MKRLSLRVEDKTLETIQKETLENRMFYGKFVEGAINFALKKGYCFLTEMKRKGK
jgi:hypothetical protein